MRWSSLRRLEGTHRVEGILIANGPHIRRGGSATGRIVDIAPTLLAALGLKVPSDMEGSVLTDLFDRMPTVEYELPQTAEWTAHNMVAWFSQRITVGESDWADQFERQKTDGKWAYRPKASGTS